MAWFRTMRKLNIYNYGMDFAMAFHYTQLSDFELKIWPC